LYIVEVVILEEVFYKMMKVFIYAWGIYLCLRVIAVITRRRRERKRREQYRLLLHQQQEMLKRLVGVDVSSAPTLANVAAEEERRSGFGWIWVVLFVILALFMFYIFQPWIRALAILGWKDFWRMITL